MVACPRCGKPMADGFVGAQGSPAGLHWYHGFAGPEHFGLQGVSIGSEARGQMSWLAGSRCGDCRLILAQY